MKDYIKIGHTKKTFGVDGGLKAQIEPQFLEALIQADVVFLLVHQRPTPFFIEKIEETNDLILFFEDVESKEAAQPYCATDILLRQEDFEDVNFNDPANTGSYDQLVDYELEVVGKGGLGRIEEIAELPEQLMAILDYQGIEVLIPLNEEFIKNIDHQNKKIRMELPEGFLELFGIK